MVAINNAINNTVGASNSGVTNTLTVTNPSNTASSQALVNVTVGGATAGDAFTTYTVAGVTNWSQGIDNSNSDNFTISASTALGTTDIFSMATTGQVAFNTQTASPTQFQVLGNVNAVHEIQINNSNTNSAADCSITMFVAAATAGDAITKYIIVGGANWTTGTDNSDSDAYVISANNGLGTNNVMRVLTTGEINFPLTSAFSGYASGNISNVTGDNTTYTVLFNSEQFDQNSDFDTSTGIFTAPVSGRYQFNFSLFVFGLGAAHTGLSIFVTTTTTTFYMVNCNPVAMKDASGQLVLSGSILANMSATNTAKIQVVASGSTKTVGVGGTVGLSGFSGFLAC